MLLTFKTMSTEQMYRMVHSVYAEASYAVSLATHKKCGFLIEKVNETKDYFYDMLYVGKEE